MPSTLKAPDKSNVGVVTSEVQAKKVLSKYSTVLVSIAGNVTNELQPENVPDMSVNAGSTYKGTTVSNEQLLNA